MKTKKEVEKMITNLNTDVYVLEQYLKYFEFNNIYDDGMTDIYSVRCKDGMLFILYTPETGHLEFPKSLNDGKLTIKSWHKQLYERDDKIIKEKKGKLIRVNSNDRISYSVVSGKRIENNGQISFVDLKYARNYLTVQIDKKAKRDIELMSEFRKSINHFNKDIHETLFTSKDAYKCYNYIIKVKKNKEYPNTFTCGIINIMYSVNLSKLFWGVDKSKRKLPK